MRLNRRAGFSLMEMMCVIAILFIMAVMVLQAAGGWKERADQSRCLSNLKSLYSGVTVYIQQQGHWPQIDTRLNLGGNKEYARLWVAALRPYGISEQSWVCPTVQGNLGNPVLTKPENLRVDYLATPFDERQNTPYLWPTQPWFVEKASSHTGGNLLIFASGATKTLTQVMGRK